MDLSRRHFVGSLFAAAALPSFAQDDPSVYPCRGAFERLTLTYQHIHLGFDKPFSVLHISDTHPTAAYSDENEKKQKLHAIRMRTFGRRQEEALRVALAWAKDHVDYVDHTGDLIAYPKGEKLLKGILAGHLHISVQERFSPTAMQYVVGGNFLFHGQQVFFT